MKKSFNLLHRERPFFLVAPAFLWQLLFFYIPLVLMAIMSLLVFCPPRGTVVLALSRYGIFFNHTYFLIIVKSFILAMVNGIFCFFVGYPLAAFLVFKAGRLKPFFLFLLILPFWTNFLLHIYSWFFVLDRGGIVNSLLLFLGIISEPLILLDSITSILIVMLYCYLPFMVLPIYSSLERFDVTLKDASKDLGASRFETWYHIILPLSMSGVISGFFLVFVPSFGEFAIPGLMGGERYLFVGSVIAQYALGGKTLAYGTAFTVLSFCSLLCLIAIGFGFKELFSRYFMGEQ